MIGRSYMLDKPSPPSATKRFIDQSAMPAAIDAAASVESVLERIAIAARRQPLTLLGVALGTGWALAVLLAGRRPSA